MTSGAHAVDQDVGALALRSSGSGGVGEPGDIIRRYMRETNVFAANNAASLAGL